MPAQFDAQSFRSSSEIQYELKGIGKASLGGSAILSQLRPGLRVAAFRDAAVRRSRSAGKNAVTIFKNNAPSVTGVVDADALVDPNPPGPKAGGR
jgi:hypothetical protein